MSKLIFAKQFNWGKFEVYNDKPDVNCIRLSQTHSNIILDSNSATETCEADGLKVLKEDFKTPLAILTADCLPLLVKGKNGFALLHAGWRGVHSKILLQKEIIDLEPNYLFIGPHISGDSFEVTQEFKNNFPGSPHFLEKSDKLFFNLEQEIHAQAQALGIKDVESADICTFTDNNFNSFRRNATSKRNWNLFSPV